MDPDEVARRVHERSEARAADMQAAQTQQAATNRKNLRAYLAQLRASIPALAANDPGPPPLDVSAPRLPPTMSYLVPVTIPPSLTPRGLLRRERLDPERPTAGWMLLTWTARYLSKYAIDQTPRSKGLFMLVEGWFAIADRQNYALPPVVESTATDEHVLDLILDHDHNRTMSLNSRLGWPGEFVKNTAELFQAAGLAPPPPPDVRPTGRSFIPPSYS